MEVSTVALMIDEYAKWLRSRVEIKKINETDYVEITTPFLDRAWREKCVTCFVGSRVWDPS